MKQKMIFPFAYSKLKVLNLECCQYFHRVGFRDNMNTKLQSCWINLRKRKRGKIVPIELIWEEL